MKRRNHYIPRVLLNLFASQNQGQTVWVWQISVDGEAKEISTRDAAVGSMFYGMPATGVEEAFGPLESRFGSILGTLKTEKLHQDIYSDLRQFVYLLFIRTRALREHFVDTVQRAIGKFGQGLTQERVSKAVQQELRESFNKHFIEVASRLPPALQKEILALTDVPGALQKIRTSVFREAESGNISLLAGAFLSALQDKKVWDKAAKDGQIRGLARLLDSSHVPESFKPKYWTLFRRSSGLFVLGDCCAIAQSKDGNFGSLLRFGDSWRAVFLPISSTTLLIGTKTETPPSVEPEQINLMSAQLSRNYIYSQMVTEDVLALAGAIGTAPSLLTDDEINSTLDDVWNDLE